MAESSVQIADGVMKEYLVKAPQSSRSAVTGNTVDVHCTGYLSGSPLKKFWSTLDSGKTFSFQVGMRKVIRGWDDACLSMQLGEKARFAIRSDKAYGRAGFPAWSIPPNADLVFDIELVNIS